MYMVNAVWTCLCYLLITNPPLHKLIKYQINVHQFPPAPEMRRIIIISDLSGWLAGTSPTHQLYSTDDGTPDCHFLPCVQLNCVKEATPDGIGCLRLLTLGSRRAALIG